MSNHRAIWQKFYNASLLPRIEIHHIDGNHFNNDPINLLAVTINEHLEIHLRQKDWGAVQAIRMRMDLTDENRRKIKEAASLHQKELLKNNKHNWQMSPSDKSRISSKAGRYTRDNKLGIHAINADPELSRKNSSNAGKISYEKKAGFHAKPYQSESVGGTKWWVNTKTNERKRRKESPGDDWKQGIGKCKPPINAKTVKGVPWWNDGNGNKKRSTDCPGKNWKKGMK
jgi:hypothetical protein